jgi:hypothetical protein
MNIAEILLSALKKAGAGQAATMTPAEMDAFRAFSQAKSAIHTERKKAEAAIARKAFSERQLEIHDYMYALWSRLAELEYDADFHDRLVLGDAAVRFGTTEEEAKATYLAVEDAILKEQMRDSDSKAAKA